MTAHTPGPWEVVQHNHVDGELWLSVNQHADSDGMKEWLAEIKYRGAKPERQWADARLIAAAPDLLAACQGAQALLQDWFGLDEQSEAYIGLVAAIQKATEANHG